MAHPHPPRPRWLASPGVLALALALAGMPAAAAESEDACTDTFSAVPATLTTPGVWCLTQDVSTSITTDAAVYLFGAGVTLDCNGHTINGLGGGGGSLAIGVLTSGSEIVVRNCNIRGFGTGIRAAESGFYYPGQLIEDNRIDGSHRTGIASDATGIIIRRNRVIGIGGTSTQAATPTGIAAGPSAFVLDNDVSGVAPPVGSGLGARGIAGGALVQGNRVRGLAQDGAGTLVAIEVGNLAFAVLDNAITGFGNGTGISCQAPVPARRNAVNGFTTGISTCLTGSGENEVTP